MWEKIQENMKQAMRSGDKEKLQTLRMLISSIRNKQIEEGSRGEEISDEKVAAVVKSEIKKRKDSVEAYEAGGRLDLSEKEKNEIKILEEYMPEQLGEAEIEKIIKDIIGQLNPEDAKAFNKVMSAAMTSLKGKADGALVSQLVKKMIG